MTIETLAGEKYLSFTTYRKDGTPKATPVWIVDLGDGTLGFTTSSSSWKVKRLANNPQVVLQPSNAKGDVTVGTEPTGGQAVTHIGGAEFDRVKALVKKKYGIQYAMITAVGNAAKLIGKGSGTDSAIVITLDS